LHESTLGSPSRAHPGAGRPPCFFSMQPTAYGNAAGAPQQQQMMPGDIFQGAQKIFIKQEMAMIELCGIEAKQRYRISVPTEDNQEGQVFLYISEESDCLTRVLCSKNRPLKLKVHNGPSKEGEVIQTMEMPCHCSGPCPCMRPNFTVQAVGDGGGVEKIGSIDDPCHCCTMDQKVLGANDNEVFSVDGSICQMGMCCPCCAPVIFAAKKGDRQVAGVEKLPLDLSDCCLKTNRFIVDFGELKDPTERKLMLASAMLLDLEYFEEDK